MHLWFRRYLLVKWLQVNYKEPLEAREVREFSEKVAALTAETNKGERRTRRDIFGVIEAGGQIAANARFLALKEV